MSVEYAIETAGLVKQYGIKSVINGLDMRIPRASIYGFVGRNGAGKTTTMKMMAGLATPTRGSIACFGQPLASYRAPIGTLIENPGLLRNMNAYRNCMTKALAMGIANPKAECALLLDLVGLESVGKLKVKGFSLGMKQRLGLALALIGSPDVLLLDEPLNGLDVEGTHDMRNLLIRLRDERGVTIVISSHVLDQLNRVADRFGVIDAGHMVTEFTDEEMRAACGEFVRLRTTDTARAMTLLAEALPTCSLNALSDGAIAISFAKGIAPDTQQVARVMQDANLPIYELAIMRQDIEDYFLKIMEQASAQEGGNHV